jgi:hypothetical protein
MIDYNDITFHKKIVTEYYDKVNSGIYNGNKYIKQVEGKGWGVFANVNFKEGDIIEFCRAHIMPLREEIIKIPCLEKFCYWADCGCDRCLKEGQRPVVVLGYGSLYNSVSSKEMRNTAYIQYLNINLQIFIADRDIKKNEELVCFHGEKFFKKWCTREIIMPDTEY